MGLIRPENYPLPLGHPLSVRTLRPADPNLGALSDGAVKDLKAPAATSDADALLRIVDVQTFLHSRPFEFFLGNGTEHNRITMFVTFDANVYQKEDAEEFMRECREATLHYLGDGATVKGKL